MGNNKKIKNATLSEYDGIALKSLLERLVYKTLVENGIKPEYEKEKIVLIEGFKPTKPFFTRARDRKTKKWKSLWDYKKLISITYTPDFTFTYKGIKVYIEAKGFENDVFPVKKKLFRLWLEKQENPVIYAEIFTKKQLLELIDYLKNV